MRIDGLNTALDLENKELEAVVEEQRLRLECLVKPAEEATGKQGSTAILTYIARLEAERDKFMELIAELAELLKDMTKLYIEEATMNDIDFDQTAQIEVCAVKALLNKASHAELVEALDTILNFKAIDPDGYVGAVRDVAKAALNKAREVMK